MGTFKAPYRGPSGDVGRYRVQVFRVWSSETNKWKRYCQPVLLGLGGVCSFLHSLATLKYAASLKTCNANP